MVTRKGVPPSPILTNSPDDIFLSHLIDALPVGVIVLDHEGRVVRYNAYEQRLAGRTAESVIGKLFFQEVAPCTATSDLYPAFYKYVRDGEPLNVDLTFQFPFEHLPVPRDVRLRLCGFLSGGHRFAFLLVEDISEEVQARRMRELLAMLVAHDMKNPLASLRLNVDLLMTELEHAPRQKLIEARMAADRLDRMIRLFLDVYKLENAELTVARGPVDLQRLGEQVLRSQQPLATIYGISLRLAGRVPIFHADASLLLRILENLLDNALRHAQSSIAIEISHVEEVGVEIKVIDDGPGVPEEARAKVFDKFASMSADLRGYNQGLGLTFCSLAVQKLGGVIDVYDANPNGGAVFRIRLPYHSS